MVALATSPAVLEAVRIPYVNAAEAETLLLTELERFTALVASLGPDDWDRPTACTAWSVRDVLAHQAGGYTSGTGYAEMLRQYSALPRRGQLPEDAINERQLRDRAGQSPAQLIAELRQAGPLAARNWAYGFGPLKPIAVPHPIGGLLSVRHLMWVIHSRDTWMHRLDLCRATRRDFQQTPEHDGRIVALVLRDIGRRLHRRLAGRAVQFNLSGEAGGAWIVGQGSAAAAIHMDALDFNILASGRFTYAEGRARADLSGDLALAEVALRQAQALY